MWTEWLEWEGDWYYLNPSGVMHTGWLQDDGKWYYFTSRGVMVKRWVQIDGKWYYFEPSDGHMKTGWIHLDNKWYYFNDDGSMRTGWIRLDGAWYYFNDDGAMRTGWLCLDDVWYYMSDKGVMQTDWVYVDGNWYYFLSNGHMNTKNLTQGNREYTFYSSGRLLSTEILVQAQRQHKENWCWAASSAMVGTYNTSSTKTQEDIVRHVKGSIIDIGGVDSEMIDGINYASNYTKSAKQIKAVNITYKGMVSYIDKNHPFIINFIWGDGFGHSVAATGYKNDTMEICLINPGGLIVKSKYYKYKDIMEDGVTFNTYTGTCDTIIVY